MSTIYLESLCDADGIGRRGVIEVRRGTVLLGYVRNTFVSQNCYTYGTLDQALIVAGPNITDGPAVDLIALNGPDPSYPRVGLVGGQGGYNFSPGQIGYAYITGTGKSAYHSSETFTRADCGAIKQTPMLCLRSPPDTRSTVWGTMARQRARSGAWHATGR